MASLGKLKHVAGGIVDSFIHRNNDVGGHWALGLLYRDAPADLCVRLDLLETRAAPSNRIAAIVARNYGQFLRQAALKQGIPFDELAEAHVEVRFNANLQLPGVGWEYIGDPFLCQVTLQSKKGQTATKQGVGRCLRYEKGRFGGRTPGDDSILASLENDLGVM